MPTAAANEETTCRSGQAPPTRWAPPTTVPGPTSPCSARSPNGSNCACSTPTAPRPASTCPRWTAWSGTPSCPGSSRASCYGYRVHGPYDPAAGPSLQPEQAAAGPLRQGHRRPVRLGPVAVRLQLRRPGQPQRRRLGAAHAQVGGDQPVLRLGRRPAAEAPVRRHRDLRGARQGPHRAAPGRPRGAARHLRRRRPPGDHRAPQAARRHRHRADAGTPLRQRRHPAGQGPDQLLGLQHDRLPRPGLQVQLLAQPGRPGAGVQGDGAGAARRRHRGHPRRRLQPHRRGQPPGPDGQLPRHRQRRLLPAGGRATRATTPTTPAPATASTSGIRTRCS